MVFIWRVKPSKAYLREDFLEMTFLSTKGSLWQSSDEVVCDGVEKSWNSEFSKFQKLNFTYNVYASHIISVLWLTNFCLRQTLVNFDFDSRFQHDDNTKTFVSWLLGIPLESIDKALAFKSGSKLSKTRKTQQARDVTTFISCSFCINGYVWLSRGF